MSRLFFVVAIALFGASSARGGFVTGLYNTGIDTNGNLANDRTSDPHYTLIRSADGSISVPQSAVVADTTKFPFVTDGWLASGTLSKWIAPISNQSVGNSIGGYAYRTTFQIVGGDPTGIRITGIWTADNYGKDIVINGHSTGISYRAPSNYTLNIEKVATRIFRSANYPAKSPTRTSCSKSALQMTRPCTIGTWNG